MNHPICYTDNILNYLAPHILCRIFHRLPVQKLILFMLSSNEIIAQAATKMVFQTVEINSPIFSPSNIFLQLPTVLKFNFHNCRLFAKYFSQHTRTLTVLMFLDEELHYSNLKYELLQYSWFCPFKLLRSLRIINYHHDGPSSETVIKQKLQANYNFLTANILGKFESLKKIEISLFKSSGFHSLVRPLRILNENQRSLDLSFGGILNAANEPISIGRIPPMANLISLNLSCCGIVEMGNFDQFVNLRTLNLSTNNISKISDLGHLLFLESLDLSKNKISHIRNLSHLISLKTLNLSENDISEFSELNYHGCLQTLDLSNNQIFKIQNMSRFRSLKILNLKLNMVEELENLAELVSLESLDLSDNYSLQLKDLGCIKSLKMLYLSDNSIRGVMNFAGFDSLEILDLSWNKLSRIQNLGLVKCLRKLELSQNYHEDEGNLADLVGLEHSECLERIRNKNFEDVNLSHLKSVEVLEFTICYHYFSKLQHQLSWKDVAQKCGIEPRDVLELSTYVFSNLIGLKLLNLFLCISGDIAFPKMPNLQRLEIDQNDRVIVWLDLCNLLQLEDLKIRRCHIEKIKNLEMLVKLRKLSLHFCEIERIENLDNLTELQCLDLSFNRISNIENLHQLTKLVNLDLSSNKISSASGLPNLSELEVDLSHNNIEKVAIEEIIGVQKISLADNPLTCFHTSKRGVITLTLAAVKTFLNKFIIKDPVVEPVKKCYLRQILISPCHWPDIKCFLGIKTLKTLLIMHGMWNYCNFLVDELRRKHT